MPPAPYTQSRTPHWLGDIEINPSDSNQVLFVTGYGIWRCLNASAADSGRPTRWVFHDAGLEETVPLALISPPQGPHLFSGVGDIDGFRHDDLTVSPAEGNFPGPRFVNTEDLAYAGGYPLVIARTGTVGNQDVRAAFSRDGGGYWQELDSEPPSGDGAGTITLAADAHAMIWTPRGGEPYLTTNWGANWTACAGLSTGTRVVADTIDPDAFYAFDARTGKLYASTNGGTSFTATLAALEAQPNNRYNGGAVLTATPGLESDIWLASRTAGLLHSTNAGASFTKLELVQEADAFGLGKAAPGRNYPALFLAGKIHDQPALFRSDDTGASWVRINDDRHQYGRVSHVIGDPRVYGRVYFATGGRGVIYGEIQNDPLPAQN